MDLSGGCFCGAIRYACDGDPIVSYFCHCRDCQRFMGGACAACVLVPSTLLRVIRGEPVRFESPGGSGATIVREFCGICESPLFSSSPARPDSRVIRAGSLDHADQIRPTLHIWADSALPWGLQEDGLPRLPQGPPRSP
jgi:hypothetical protein